MAAAPSSAALGTRASAWPVPKATTNRVLFCCWLAILAEGYDVGVLGAVLPSLAEYGDWSLTPLQLGGLGSYALVGMLIGAMCIGTLSDLFGRRRMLAVSMIIFTLTQLGAALAPTPEVFGLFRLLGGLGMGGIIPVAAALTIEYSAPSKLGPVRPRVPADARVALGRGLRRRADHHPPAHHGPRARVPRVPRVQGPQGEGPGARGQARHLAVHCR